MLLELSFDVVFSVLENLSTQSLADVSCVSHLFMLLVHEVQRRPMLISDISGTDDIMLKLRQRLLTKPTIAIMFSSGDLQSPAIKAMVQNQLPPNVQLIGAHTNALQATNSDTQMECCEEEDKVALMLGHFPEAECKAFFLSYDVCEKAASNGVEELQKAGLSMEKKWGVFMLLSCGQASRYAEDIINLLQASDASAALMGGIAGQQVIQMSGGLLEVNSNGIVVLAFAGNVPVTALVSRGCVPVSQVYHISKAGKLHTLAYHMISQKHMKTMQHNLQYSCEYIQI